MTSDISILDCQQKLTNSSKNCCGAKENRIVHLNVVLYFRDFGKVDLTNSQLFDPVSTIAQIASVSFRFSP